MPSQIAAQLYTLRDFCKKPTDLAHTLAKVKRIGFDAVQVSGVGKIEPRELRALLDTNGLTCCATHVGLDRVTADAQNLVAEHQLWNCKLTAIGGYWDAKTFADWEAFAATYDAAAEKLNALGLKLGYHNHSHELSKYGGPTTALAHLIGTCPNVWFEIDTYWIAHGGGDPAAYIDRVAGRIPAVHLKDMSVTPERKPLMAEVGEGNLHWPRIFEACKRAGVEWYIIEQDDCNGRDPFESLDISLRNLKAMGIA